MPKMREHAKAIMQAAQNYTDQKVWIAYAIIKEIRLTDGQVKAIIYPDDLETEWVDCCQLLKGDGYFVGGLPEVGTVVLALFIGADPNEILILKDFGADGDELPEAFEDEKDFFIIPRHGGKIIFKSTGIILETSQDIAINATDGKVVVNSDNVYLGAESGSKGVLTETFEDQYNSQMATLAALLIAHTNTIAPDPTLSSLATQIGNLATASTKVKAV